MCKHTWSEINDVRVCTKCGATLTYDGKILFDRNINYKPKKRKAKKK